MSLPALLGETLLTASGPVPTSSLSASNRVVVLYFSAHWCGPCRATTPVLAKAYTESLHKLGMEVVFVSSDEDERAFSSYHASMPWPALPFKERALKDKLSRMFKVRGIPTMVILDAKTAEVITLDGRSNIMSDLKGANFPWIPEPLTALLDKGKLVKGSTTLSFSDVKAEVVGLLFSASWCGPCQSFKKALIPTYNALAAADAKAPEKRKQFEVILLGEDEDQGDFDKFRADMPWLALAFEAQDVKEKLGQRFQVSGIPHFVLFERDTGHIISESAVEAVMTDPSGFPWRPRPVEILSGGVAQAFSEGPVCVVFSTDNAAAKAVQASLEGDVAKWKADDALKLGDMVFVVAGSHPIKAKLVEMMSGKKPAVAVFDLTQGRVFLGGDSAAPGAVKDLVAGVVSGAAPSVAVKGGGAR